MVEVNKKHQPVDPSLEVAPVDLTTICGASKGIKNQIHMTEKRQIKHTAPFLDVIHYIYSILYYIYTLHIIA